MEGELVTRKFGRRIGPLHIFVLAFIVALIFCFVIFPRASGGYHLVLDPDQYGELGLGIYKSHTFSYYPESAPSIQRGPLYPGFIAVALGLTNGWYPGAVQFAQCLVFAATALIVYRMARTIWNRKVAAIVGVVCALNPLAVWFTSRIWVEVLAGFLLALIMLAAVSATCRPDMKRAVILGVSLGLAALCKSTFLPFVVIVPLLVRYAAPRQFRLPHGAVTVLVAFAIVSPWTVRNYILTRSFVPVHTLAGVACCVGDKMVDNFPLAPFSMQVLYHHGPDVIESLRVDIPKDLPRHEQEMLLEKTAIQRCISRYVRDPWFYAKKLAINAMWFWTLSESPKKSLVISSVQVPLFLAFLLSGVVIYRRKSGSRILGMLIWCVIIYYAMHIPLYAQARYSAILLPIMLMCVIGTASGVVPFSDRDTVQPDPEPVQPDDIPSSAAGTTVADSGGSSLCS